MFDRKMFVFGVLNTTHTIPPAKAGLEPFPLFVYTKLY